MTDELVCKIKNLLDAGINEEKDVVYLLVEIRKLMAREKREDPIVHSFANWVVHTELTQERAGTTELLTEFDTIITLSVEKTSTKRLPIHFNFYGLQKRLKALLTHFRLPIRLVEDADCWGRFVAMYASIVGDCPVTFKASKTKLTYLRELQLRKRPDAPILEWKVVLDDGEVSYFRSDTASFEPPLKRRGP